MFLQAWQQKGNNVRFSESKMSRKTRGRKFGSKSHPSHRKQVVARRFSPFSKSWRCYWKIQNLLCELGFEYHSSKDTQKSTAAGESSQGLRSTGVGESRQGPRSIGVEESPSVAANPPPPLPPPSLLTDLNDNWGLLEQSLNIRPETTDRAGQDYQ